jgi:hypothetical protein
MIRTGFRKIGSRREDRVTNLVTPGRQLKIRTQEPGHQAEFVVIAIAVFSPAAPTESAGLQQPAHDTEALGNDTTFLGVRLAGDVNRRLPEWVHMSRVIGVEFLDVARAPVAYG